MGYLFRAGGLTVGEVVAFPNRRITVEWHRLIKQERDALVTCLLQNSLGTYLSFHNGGQYACVYDAAGAPYCLGRQEGAYVLFGPNENLIAESPQFRVVLDALATRLTLTSNVPG